MDDAASCCCRCAPDLVWPTERRSRPTSVIALCPCAGGGPPELPDAFIPAPLFRLAPPWGRRLDLAPLS